AWLQDAPKLAERPRLVADGTENERRHNGVELRVGELFGRRLDELDRARLLANPPRQPTCHWCLWLGNGERLDTLAVGWEVCASASPDLEHAAPSAAEEPLAMCPEASRLDARRNP